MPDAERSCAPVSSDTIEWTILSHGERFGVRYRHLSLAMLGDGYRVGVAIEELAPGRRTAPAHYHILEEEHLYILEGSLTARLGASSFPMRTGDYICFPAGQTIGHTLINDGDRPCRYVIIGENNPNEIVVYTDTRKVLVRALGRRALYDMASTRTFFDGEDVGAPDPDTPFSDAGLVAEEAAASFVRPIHAEGIEWNHEGNGQNFAGCSRHLTYAATGNANYHVGVLIESPAPGKRMCPKHYHMGEEEHALVLEGEIMLLLGDERHVMRPGDFVSFPAGRKVGHAFLNATDAPASYLMIGERNPEDVCVYPDSNKIAVSALRQRDAIFDMAARRGYYDGE